MTQVNVKSDFKTLGFSVDFMQSDGEPSAVCL